MRKIIIDCERIHAYTVLHCIVASIDDEDISGAIHRHASGITKAGPGNTDAKAAAQRVDRTDTDDLDGAYEAAVSDAILPSTRRASVISR
jgi:hypothetical protein